MGEDQTSGYHEFDLGHVGSEGPLNHLNGEVKRAGASVKRSLEGRFGLEVKQIVTIIWGTRGRVRF